MNNLDPVSLNVVRLKLAGANSKTLRARENAGERFRERKPSEQRKEKGRECKVRDD